MGVIAKSSIPDILAKLHSRTTLIANESFHCHNYYIATTPFCTEILENDSYFTYINKNKTSSLSR